MTNIVNIGPKGSRLDWDNWGKPITDAVNNLWNLVVVQTQQTAWSVSTSSAIGSTPTAVLTISSAVLQAKTAYAAEVIGGVQGSTVNEAEFGLWKTAVGGGGTQIGTYYRTLTNTGGFIRNCYSRIYIVNDTSADIVADVLLSLSCNTGTATHEASAGRPRQLVLTWKGASSAFPGAFKVT